MGCCRWDQIYFHQALAIAGAAAHPLQWQKMEGILIQQVLDAMPMEWKGTTFRNSNLLGREVFSKGLNALLAERNADSPISSADLESLGMAEDYLRVASNVSTTLEAFIARRKNCATSNIITFGSAVMPIVAVALVCRGTAHCYYGDVDTSCPLSADALDVVRLLGGKVEFHAGPPQAHQDGVVLRLHTQLVSAGTDIDSDSAYEASGVDAIVTPYVLHVLNPATIRVGDVEVIRKRLATPLTSPVALDMMSKLARGVGLQGTWTPATADEEWPALDAARLAGFYSHLQSMTGAPVDATNRPFAYTAGLPATCAIFLALARNGGCELIMCSTCYGGSSQLADLLIARTPTTLRKHTFGIQGNTDIVQSLRSAMEKVSALPVEEEGARKQRTLLFIEVPTNPDMKVPDLDALADMIDAYVKAKAGRSMDDFLLMIDATFAPGSEAMKLVQARLPALPVFVFISMSKSVSRGKTTGGALIANGNPTAQMLLSEAGKIGKALDTLYKLDQMEFLVGNHEGVEDRCRQAYSVAVAVGETLQEAVRTHAKGYDMPLAFVKPEHAAMGFTSSTFSFNLPRPEGASQEQTEAFAQRFVDLLTEDKQFKPCVSFGQDNGLIYCTVPATSTQGAIKAEDKALQAVGGVQLVRLSFPPTMDLANAQRHVAATVARAYA